MKRIAIRQGSANDGGRKITHQDIMGVEEIQEKRGLCCKHYRMGAGKACAVYFNEPVHYYDEDSKELKEIDNTIRRIEQAEGEKGGYENASGEVKIRFARSIGDAAFLTLEKGMHKMSWRLCDSSAACLKIPAEQKSEVSAEVITRKTASHAAELRGRFREINAAAEEAFRKSRSEVRYNGIKQGADLQYILGNSRLKENIVIKQKMPDYRFVFEIAAECLELELSENKDELEFYVLKIGENNQREKEVIFAMPAAYMYDAKGNRSENVVYEVEQSGAGKYILNVTADKQWIESAEREFPVTIDPTVVFQKNNFITTRTIFSSNGVSSPADAIDVTAGWLTGGIEARVLLKWNTGALGNVKVTGAFLNLYKEDASYTYDDYAFKKDFEIRELTESWNAQTVTWATSPSCGGLVDILRYSTELAGPGSGDEIVSFDVTKAWENPNGVMIKAAQGEVPHSPNGNECSHYIQFYSEHVESDYEACKPYLLVTYMENNQVRSDQQLTNSVGRAGNASLDLFTKNLQFTHSDLELQGNILPLSVTHVYNSRTGTDKDVASSRGKYSSGNLGMGAGWKTNLHQYMIPYTQLTGTAEGDFAVPKYIYIDAAGDEHVFNRVKLNQDTYEYTDENGSGLIFDPTNYRLEDKSGGKMEFSKTKYRLEALEDGEGNRLEITYNGTGQISAVEDGSGRTATLRYDGLGGSSGAAAANPLLKSIAYNGTDVAEFTYSGAGKLTQISYPDGTHSEFTYGADGTLQSARDSSGYRIAYTRSGNTIVVAESTNVSKIADNSVTACAEKSGSSVTVTYAAGRTYIDTQEGKRTVHIFNAAGRSVCSYVDGNGAAGGGIEALRVTAASQNETFAAEVSCGAENRITGGGYENSASGWAANEPGIGGVSAQEHLGGAYSYRIQGDVSSHRYAEKEFLVSGDPRCLVLSAFAKADSLPANESNGALFRIGGQIVYRDGTSEEMRFADFDPYITDWQGAGLGLAKSRANAAKTVLHVKVRLEYTKNSGSAYFDGLSLREGTYARQSSESRYILEGNVADYPIEDITKITYVSEGFLAAQQWTDIPTYEGGKQLLTGEDLQKMLTQDMSSGLARIYVGGEEKANDAVVDDLFWETGRPSIYFSVQRDSGSDRKYDLLRGFVLRAGQIVETEDGTGLSVRLRTDKRGNVVETTLVGTGGKEYTTEYGYDGRSRQTTEETWRGLCKETEYSGVNIVKETLRVADETDAAERMIQNYAYANGGNYLSRLHDGRGSGNPTQYDTNFSYSHAYGRLTTVTLAGGQQLNYNYKTDGSLGSISALVDEDSCENSYNYTRGLLTKLVTNGSTGGSGASANKKVYTFEYDGFGALTKVYENGEEVRRYAYSAGSDYTGGESTYNYAAAGQVVAGGADGRIEWEKTIYTRDGAVLSVKSYATDGNGNLSGTESEIVRAVYDDSGRLTTLQDKRAGQTYSYAYDAAGRATGVTLTGRITGGTEEETDAEGRVTEKRLRLGAEERRYGYAYERDGGSAVPGGRAESAELPSGDTVSYGYDVLGRLKEKSLTLAGTGTDGGTYGGSTPDTKLRETYNYLRAPANDRTTEYVANIQYAGKNYSASAVYAYDEKGNVKSVTDGGRYTSYGYDGMSRLTRENNQALGFTKTYEYDANGNILTVKKYAYTTAVSLGTPEETAEYTYGTGARRDRLVSVVRRSGTKIIGNEEISGYDTLGNPCNYMGNVIEWEYGRRMRSCGGITYKYGADGVRTEKTVNGTVHKYYAEGETLHFETRTNAGGGMQKLWYYYDGSGICGVEYNGSVYYFQKNLQGDVTRVYDGNGNLAAQYVYDAWGNHKVLNANGTEITDESFIGNVNPIRYRGYYYDEETGLYYLQSRYYDPEVGRFINADDVDYIEPETLMGCNLYAYCGNNPVMYVDPTGTIFGFILGAFAIGALIGGGLSYISAYNDGQRGWGLFGAIAGGAIMGGAMGGILALGGAVGLASAGLMSFGMTAGTALGVSLGVGAAAGMISYSLENGLRTDREWSVGGMFKAGFVGALKGGVTFGIGVIGGKAGAFDKLALKGLLGKELVKDSVSYGIAKGLLSAAMPSFLRNLFTWSSFYLGETLTKLLFISSIASGARWLIDQIFGL